MPTNGTKVSIPLAHTFFLIFSLAFIIPFLYVISISVSSDKDILEFGYQLIPKNFDFTAYKYIIKNPTQLINSYSTTIIFSVLGTVLGVVVMSLAAYPISRSYFRYKKGFTFFMYFTMLFSGGLVPTYILITQYLHLSDTIWVYIFPTLANAWYIFILRTFFQSLPESLVESAKIDGAKESRIFFQIIFPLSKPAIATIALFKLLASWNDWYTALLYIRNKNLYSLQYLLQKILREVEFLRNMATQRPVGLDISSMSSLPTESLRFAMVIVAAGPMLFIFPFFQKYFVKGLTIGSVKG